MRSWLRSEHPRLVLAGATIAILIASLAAARPAGALTESPPLGTAATHALIAAQGVTSAGRSTVDGDLAIAATDDLAGFPPGIVTGAVHLADPEAVAAASDALAAARALRVAPCSSDRTGEDQGGLRLATGVYCYVESASLDGTLRLDALGDPDATWIFQVAGTFQVANGAEMLLVNGARACNVFWQVSDAITIGAGSSVAGTFVSEGDISVGTGATVAGRLLAPQGAVDLDRADVTLPAACAATGATTTTTPTTATTPTTTAPVPGSGPGETGSPTDEGGTGAPDQGTGSLPETGPSALLAIAALSAIALGSGLVRSERALEVRRKRWRPRFRAGFVDRHEAKIRWLLGHDRPPTDDV